MKKKMIALVLALTLVVSQAVIFASADSWVDDSSYPNGGYWIDDNGNPIEGGGSAPAPEINLVTGENEPEYGNPETYDDPGSDAPSSEGGENNESGENGAATEATVTAITSRDPSAVQFYVNANGSVDFKFFYLAKEVHPNYSFNNGTLTVPGGVGYLVKVYGADGKSWSALAINEHYYSIAYSLDGNKTVVSDSDENILVSGNTLTYTAPVMIARDNVEYELIGGESNATQILSYGTSDYVFEYQAYNPQDLTAAVESVDERGNRLQYDSATIKYRGGDVIFNLPNLIEKDGRSYIKVENTSKITVNYYSSNLNYTVKYREAVPVSTQPYSVKVNYVDSVTGSSIGGSFFNVTAQNIVDEANVTFALPKEIAYYTGSSTIYYQPEIESIQHSAAGNKTAEYTVKFTKMAEDAPYTWSVRLVDVASGDVLDTKNYPITVSSSATHTTSPQVVVNGTTWVMDGSMQNEYVHNYGDKNRIQYIYYNAEGTQAATAYDIKVRYVEIGGNTELSSQSYTVQPGEEAQIATDENYQAADGTEYVRLQGQGDVDHSFFSPQRTYSVYYRDVNDVQNADTVVVRQEIIDLGTTVPEEPVTEEPVTEEPEAEESAAPETEETVPNQNAPLANAVEGTGNQTTVITNDTTGNTELVDDEGVPMEDRAQEEIESSGAPLAGNAETNDGEDIAANPEQAKAEGVNWILIVSIAAILMVIAAGITVFVYTKKKKSK